MWTSLKENFDPLSINSAFTTSLFKMTVIFHVHPVPCCLNSIWYWHIISIGLDDSNRATCGSCRQLPLPILMFRYPIPKKEQKEKGESSTVGQLLATPLPTKSSSTTFSTGFMAAHAAASRRPSSKNMSRMWSSAGSSAQLKSWINVFQQSSSWNWNTQQVERGRDNILSFPGLIGITSLGVAVNSGFKSGLIPIPFRPSRVTGKAQTRTCQIKDNSYCTII